MTDLDLSKYEGHTEGPWSWDGYSAILAWLQKGHPLDESIDDEPGAGALALMTHPDGERGDLLRSREQEANARLIADAPLLLAEVRRLREEIRARDEFTYNVLSEVIPYVAVGQHSSQFRIEEAGRLLRQFSSLHQSHARLLAALLLVGRVERRGGVPYYNTSGSLIHQDQMRELGAAVAEAEALR